MFLGAHAIASIGIMDWQLIKSFLSIVEVHKCMTGADIIVFFLSL